MEVLSSPGPASSATLLFGVIDPYQTRVATKSTVAVERLAVVAAVTLAITALASVHA